MRSVTRVFLEVYVIIHCIDKPLFFFDVLKSFVYAMAILFSEHTHSRQNMGRGGRGGGGGMFSVSR